MCEVAEAFLRIGHAEMVAGVVSNFGFRSFIEHSTAINYFNDIDNDDSHMYAYIAGTKCSTTAIYIYPMHRRNQVLNLCHILPGVDCCNGGPLHLHIYIIYICISTFIAN